MLNDASAQVGNPRGGLESLVDAAGLSIERMPMLHVIFDRMVTQCSEAMRTLSSAPAFFSVADMKSKRMGDILDSFEGHVIAAVYYSPVWDSRILIALDHAFVFNFVEALLGGDGAEPPYYEDRPLSAIEVKMAQAVIDPTSKALSAAFAVVSDTTFKFERVETRMDFVAVANRSTFAVVSEISLRVLERGGSMFIVIPQGALNPIKESLARDISDEMSTPDPRWTKQIQNEVGRADVVVQGVLEDHSFTLGDIAELRVGQVLKLTVKTDSHIKLECNDQALFLCQLGQGEGHYTLRVDAFIDQEQELIDDILSR